MIPETRHGHQSRDIFITEAVNRHVAVFGDVVGRRNCGMRQTVVRYSKPAIRRNHRDGPVIPGAGKGVVGMPGLFPAPPGIGVCAFLEDQEHLEIRSEVYLQVIVRCWLFLL